MSHSITQLAFRIGHGYDVHRFGAGNAIILGGVKISHTKRLIAHSDGDVLIHALCDAMLGSIGAGDIGQHFPDSDLKYKNIDSCILLKKCHQRLKNANYSIANIDTTIIAQQPKIAPHIQAIKIRLAETLQLSESQINIKATTTEKLGFCGREEGIAVHSVILVNHDV